MATTRSPAFLVATPLSDFPHAAVYDGPLAEVDFKPSPLFWVPGIHIRHKTAGYGAFCEDMLLDDSYFA